LLKLEQIHKILTEEFGLRHVGLENSDQHLYFIESKLFGEDFSKQVESERGNFLVFQEQSKKMWTRRKFIMIFSVLSEELGMYYLNCWGDTFDNCTVNKDGKEWLEVLTEEDLRDMVSKLLYSVKMVENQIELDKIKEDFG
jgi:hypothetical protein